MIKLSKNHHHLSSPTRRLFVINMLFFIFFFLPLAHAKMATPAGVEQSQDEGVIQSSKVKNYYKMIRERILNKAYRLYARDDEGQVAIVFTLNTKGFVSDVKIVEEKTQATPYLQDITLKAVRSIRRFPAFPKELQNYKVLNFNLVITFKIRE